jgi:hypothetical protein
MKQERRCTAISRSISKSGIFGARQAAVAVGLFILAIAAALSEDLIPAEWNWPKIATWVFFLLGLAVLAYLVYRLPHGK